MNNGQFLEQFKAIELSLRVELKLSERDHMSFNEMVYRSRRRVFKSSYHQEILENAAQLRNMLSHKHDVATIHPVFADQFEVVARRILTPLKAEHRMTPYSHVERLHLTDPLNKAITIMRKHRFQNLPVLLNDRCVGMFNESTLFYALQATKELHVDLNTPIQAFEGHLSIEDHPTHLYTFVSRSTTLDAIAEQFSEFLTHDQKRLELVIVTENGKASETMLGILTPEDLIDIYMQD